MGFRFGFKPAPSIDSPHPIKAQQRRDARLADRQAMIYAEEATMAAHRQQALHSGMPPHEYDRRVRAARRRLGF